ncbi:LysR family transcriptional regulator [Oceanicella actignis]|uniref:DNA-binding transcriptional regulator, LysR family n=1 Tax=Oceanicella actignis TaxID=1189325 RepID=A0A1M7T6G0_9RHOB|nr:LysR family transcriptional regulator [Oceanicella actignis]TYO84818.1 DNA-binding transcriptional LysR family regulator [Oceanicella actignis]SET44797.1 DNA-binding transcriptional regulator, LysR family [Oceanicella actignis]SHN66297.1 DNA-binding transcriptional regulator, LysR family [Oceanicella actignis]
MNWDDLRFFLQVARTGRLTQAARALGVDHATVSRRIGALEDAVQAKLFDRSPRGYALTEAGQRLLPAAEAIESAAMSGAAAVGGRQHALSGAVRVGMPEGAASHLVTETAALLCDAHPQLELQIVALPRSFSLSQREADFAVVVTPPESGRLRIRKIADYHLRLYAARSFLAGREPRSLDDLRGMRGVGYVQDLIFDKGLDYVAEIGGGLSPQLTSTSLLVQLELTLAGGGLCILPDFMARRRPELVPVLPEQTCLTRAYWLVLHQNTAEIPRIRRVAHAFADAMRQKLAEAEAQPPDSAAKAT